MSTCGSSSNVYRNFMPGQRYGRADGKIVMITTRWEYTIAKNGGVGALVTGDDGIVRYDDEPNLLGRCIMTSNSPTSLDISPGAIPPGQVNTGPLKIR
jgi:hypothetical protein